MASKSSSIRSLARSFAGGEVTPEFFGRVDDVKNLTGLGRCRNFQVLPHGPVANRTGTRFVKEVKDSTSHTRLIDFAYSDTQTMVLELGHQYIRFHTMGGTLLAGTPAAYNGATVYALADLVTSGGIRYYSLQAGNTGHTPASSPTYWYAMPADGTYEIPTPYSSSDIFDIHFVQSQDVLSLAHPNYPPAELRRYGATNWQLVNISTGSTLTTPTGTSAVATVATGSGLAPMSYVVTAVGSDGVDESLASTSSTCSNNLLTTGNYNTISWTTTGATRYNVYKLSNGLYGYIGQTTNLSFIDDNITADISRTPPNTQTPFVGAGNYPAAISYYEQRRDFGGTTNLPATIWMTRSGTESNLNYSIPSRDNDAISFRIAARDRNTVRHFVPLLDLLVLTSSGLWRVTSVNSDSITPTSIAVKQQNNIGASNAQPVIANDAVVYAANRGGHVWAARYGIEQTYKSKDLSLRAPHLFNNRAIVDMAYARAPYPVVFATSSNGLLLGITYVPDEEIEAWHWHDTYTNNGDATTPIFSSFKSVTCVAEGDEDAVYAIVEREINGNTVQYIERFASRNFETLPNAYFVDCGVSYDEPITITGITKANPGVVSAPAHGLSNGDPVDIDEVSGMEQVNGQRYYAANVTGGTFELVDEFGVNINTTSFTTYTGGGYARLVLSEVISGLDHLEGETVAVLGNGAVQPQQTVVGGAITLDEPASVIQIGLPIEADIETLPLAFEAEAFGQGRRKNVNQVWLRVYQSSGIFAGPSFDNLTEKKQRTTEPYGTPPVLKDEELSLKVQGKWGDSGTVCIRQSDPLPLTIVSMTLEVSVA